MVRDFMGVCTVFFLSLMAGIMLAGILSVGCIAARQRQLAASSACVIDMGAFSKEDAFDFLNPLFSGNGDHIRKTP